MAYEVLSNPDKRRLYDQAGEQGIKEGGSGGGGFGGSNPMDIFDMFFGGGDPFGRGGRSSWFLLDHDFCPLDQMDHHLR